MRQYRRPLFMWLGLIVAISLIFIMLPALSAQAAELKLPSGLKRIEEQAFYGDTSLDAVTVQEGTVVIGSKAFARSSVRTVSLPASLYSIADDAFDGCENLTVNAQEGTYAYTWAVKKEYIKINGGAAGEETKVIAPDTLRAGADLVVQIIGPADTIQHSVYIVNEQTGEYQSAQLNKARENVTFSGYNFDSGSTYRLTVYTVTRQYQMLTPVNKTIQVTGQKSDALSVKLPEKMRIHQDYWFDSGIQSAVYLKAEYYSKNGELFNTYENSFAERERLTISTESFYQYENNYQYVDGGTIKIKYSTCNDGLWSNWSEIQIITVEGYEKIAIRNVSIADTIENGKDFMISFSFDDYIDHITVSIQDGKNNYLYSDSFTVGKNSGDCSVQVSSRELTAGEYYLEIYTSPVDGWIGRTLAYQKEITVSGKRKASPVLTADKEEIRYEESVRFTVSAPGYERAYVYGYETEDYTFWSAFVELDEDGYGETVYRTWYDSNRILQFKATAYDGEAWTEWTSPLSIRVTERPELSAPVIHAPNTISAGENLIFSFDEVENATEYWTDLWATNNDDSILDYYPASPTDLIEVPGYRMEVGDYTLGVRVSAEGYNSNEKQQRLTVTGRKPYGPEATVEEPLHVGQNAVFTVNTQNAEALQVRYQIASDNEKGDIYYVSVPITGDKTQWSYRIYKNFMGVESKRLLVAFSTKQNGIWSAWKGKTYILEDPLPLEPAVIHVDDIIEPRTDFGITIDPVENATRYDCYITHEDGWLICGRSFYGPIGELYYNSGDMRPGEYLIRVIAYSSDFDGNPSSTSEKTFTIKGLPPLDPVAIHVDDTIEAGKDFSIALDPVANATRYEYGLYQGEKCIRWDEGYSAVGLLRVYGYELETGSCTMKAWAYSEDYTTSYSEKKFTVIGSKQNAPGVSVDKNNVFQDENFTFTIDTTGVDALVYKKVSSYGNFYSPNSISVQGETTRWSSYNGDLGIWSYTFTVLKNGIWSEWSIPITINTSKRPDLAIPVVHASETVTAGNDYFFSFDTVEHATSYGASISSAYGGSTLYSWEEALSDTEMVVPGYILNGGSYVINVSAYADGYTTSTKTIYITISGQKPAGPDVTVAEPLRIKGKATFSVDTEGAEALQVKYQYKAQYSWWSEEQISVPVTGNTTTWEHTIDEYKQGVNLTVSFAVKVDGVWSAWKTKTYTIEGLPPLDPAVIHADDTIEAGKDFSITVDPVENATSYEYRLYKLDASVSGIITDTSIGEMYYSGAEIDPGKYTIRVWAYSNDYATSKSEKNIVIIGEKSQAPSVMVDHMDVNTQEYYTFTIDTENVEELRYRVDNYGPYKINVLEDETQWRLRSDSEANHSYCFAVRRHGIWSAWSEPITIHITGQNHNVLDAPAISVMSALESYRDLTVSLTPVDNATYYDIYLDKNDGTLSLNRYVSSENVNSISFSGYQIKPGTYTVRARAYNNYISSETSRKTITIVAASERPDPPTVTPPENTTVASGNYISFVIESSGADMIVVRYFTPGNTNDISYSTKAAQEGQDETTWSLYFSGSAQKYSFAVRKDGVWSEWSEFVTISLIQ